MDKVEIRFAQNEQDLAAYYGVRHEVFVVGQNVPADMERDAYDARPDTWHLLATLNGAPVGTLRVVFTDDGTAKIGRVAVLETARGKGIAKMLMEQVLEDLPAHGVTVAVLSAQAYLRRFYESYGFAARGEGYEEAGIPHIWMETNLVQQAAA